MIYKTRLAWARKQRARVLDRIRKSGADHVHTEKNVYGFYTLVEYTWYGELPFPSTETAVYTVNSLGHETLKEQY